GRYDGFARLLDNAAMIGADPRTVGREASRGGRFGNRADELCKPLVEFDAIDAPLQHDDELAVPQIDVGRAVDRLVGHDLVAGKVIDGALRQPERRAPVTIVSVVLDALLDERPLEERVGRPEI